MRRLSWLLFAVLALGATAAAAADKTVGVILSGNITYYQEIQKAFAVTLVKEGFDHSKVDTLLQMPSPDVLSWTNAARKLVVADVNVLVAYGAPSALAAIRETKSIPIVFAGVYDPSAIGVAARNIAGISLRRYLSRLVSGTLELIPVVLRAATPAAEGS